MNDLAEYEKDFGGVISALRELPRVSGRDITGFVMSRISSDDDIVSKLKELPPVSGRDITGTVMAEIAKIRSREIFVSRMIRFTRTAAAVAAVSAVCWFIVSGSGDSSETPNGVVASGSGSTPEYGQVSPAAGESSAAAEWLMKSQRPDGTWAVEDLGGRSEYAPALTALAVVAMHRQNDARYDAAVMRGLRALVAMQSADGSFGGSGSAAACNQEIASGALAMLYSDRGISLLKPYVERSASAMASSGGAKSRAGWGYAGGRRGGAESAFFDGITAKSGFGFAKAGGAVGGRLYLASAAALRGRGGFRS